MNDFFTRDLRTSVECFGPIALTPDLNGKFWIGTFAVVEMANNIGTDIVSYYAQMFHLDEPLFSLFQAEWKFFQIFRCFKFNI